MDNYLSAFPKIKEYQKNEYKETKKEVIKELPDKIESSLIMEFNEEEEEVLNRRCQSKNEE